MNFYAGIDPSTATGLVIMNQNAQIIVADELVLKEKSKATYAQILEYGKYVVAQIPKGSLVAIEGFAYNAKGSAVSAQYGIGFSVRFALEEAGLEYFEVSPSALKKFAGTKGNAKKENVIKEVYKRWGYEHESNNVIDAYVLVRCAMAEQRS